eukprot:GHVU01227973.1.p1 GENE.GHVU01227973.1~~GHVU01227973.1.p1  ORF type:complete len:206 (+),score=9.23 GHVU01227973.1:319-936(+)
MRRPKTSSVVPLFPAPLPSDAPEPMLLSPPPGTAYSGGSGCAGPPTRDVSVQPRRGSPPSHVAGNHRCATPGPHTVVGAGWAPHFPVSVTTAESATGQRVDNTVNGAAGSACRVSLDNWARIISFLELKDRSSFRLLCRYCRATFAASVVELDFPPSNHRLPLAQYANLQVLRAASMGDSHCRLLAASLADGRCRNLRRLVIECA